MADVPIFTEEIAVQNVRELRDISSRPFKPINENAAKVVVSTDINSTGRPKDPDPSIAVNSLAHGRNATVKYDEDHKMRILFGGAKEADIYGDTTHKGVNMEVVPYLSPYRFSELGVHTLGLMDSEGVRRIVRVSEVMRGNGLPTEFPREIKIVKEIWSEDPSGKKIKISVNQWKDEQRQKIQNELDNFDKTEYKFEDVARERMRYLKNALKYLDKAQFVIMTRDVQSDTRLQDIESSAKKGLLKETMDPIFRWLNAVMESRGKGLIPGTPRCEKFTTSDNDLIRYFGEYYPENAGIYTGRFRKLGLYSGFMHIGNWQGVPTILDLDSVTGKKIYLTDNAPSDEDYARDLSDSVNNITSMIAEVFKRNKSLGNIDYDSLVNKASELFLRSYLKEAFGKELTSQKINTIQNLIWWDGQNANILESIKNEMFVVATN